MRTVFGLTRPLIGVVHLLPLPGAPGYRGSMTRVIDRALRDADTYLRSGFHGLIVENYGDAPYFRGRVPAETIAAQTRIATEIRNLGDVPLGINVLRSDGEAAMAIAVAARAEFVRINVFAGATVTDQGIIEGCAAEVMRLRARCRTKTAVWADLLVKHGAPLTPQSPAEQASDLVERSGADLLIVTGPSTGEAASTATLREARRAVRRIPFAVGSGITSRNLQDYWADADAFIVGTSVKKRGQTTAAPDAGRAKEMVAEHRRLQATTEKG